MDEEKIMFMVEALNYCDKAIPFVLKNVSATYQWLMDNILQTIIERDVQAYVEDMVVIFKALESHHSDLEEFYTIGKYQFKLNPGNVVFKDKAREFLDFLLTEQGIKVNLEKWLTIINIRTPANVKEVQWLTRNKWPLCLMGQRFPILPRSSKKWLLCVDQAMRDGYFETEGILIQSSSSQQTSTEQASSVVSHSNRPHN